MTPAPAKLVTTRRFADPDLLYQRLVAAHQGLSDADSRAFDARLLLILANHIGDDVVLDEAIALARTTARRAPPSSDGV